MPTTPGSTSTADAVSFPIRSVKIYCNLFADSRGKDNFSTTTTNNNNNNSNNDAQNPSSSQTASGVKGLPPTNTSILNGDDVEMIEFLSQTARQAFPGADICIIRPSDISSALSAAPSSLPTIETKSKDEDTEHAAGKSHNNNVNNNNNDEAVHTHIQRNINRRNNYVHYWRSLEADVYTNMVRRAHPYWEEIELFVTAPAAPPAAAATATTTEASAVTATTTASATTTTATTTTTTRAECSAVTAAYSDANIAYALFTRQIPVILFHDNYQNTPSSNSGGGDGSSSAVDDHSNSNNNNNNSNNNGVSANSARPHCCGHADARSTRVRQLPCRLPQETLLLWDYSRFSTLAAAEEARECKEEEEEETNGHSLAAATTAVSINETTVPQTTPKTTDAETQKRMRLCRLFFSAYGAGLKVHHRGACCADVSSSGRAAEGGGGDDAAGCHDGCGGGGDEDGALDNATQIIAEEEEEQHASVSTRSLARGAEDGKKKEDSSQPVASPDTSARAGNSAGANSAWMKGYIKENDIGYLWRRTGDILATQLRVCCHHHHHHHHYCCPNGCKDTAALSTAFSPSPSLPPPPSSSSSSSFPPSRASSLFVLRHDAAPLAIAHPAWLPTAPPPPTIPPAPASPAVFSLSVTYTIPPATAPFQSLVERLLSGAGPGAAGAVKTAAASDSNSSGVCPTETCAGGARGGAAGERQAKGKESTEEEESFYDLLVANNLLHACLHSLQRYENKGLYKYVLLLSNTLTCHCSSINGDDDDDNSNNNSDNNNNKNSDTQQRREDCHTNDKSATGGGESSPCHPARDVKRVVFIDHSAAAWEVLRGVCGTPGAAATITTTSAHGRDSLDRSSATTPEHKIHSLDVQNVQIQQEQEEQEQEQEEKEQQRRQEKQFLQCVSSAKHFESHWLDLPLPTTVCAPSCV